MTPADHRNAILAHITAHVGKPSPSNQEMTAMFGLTVRQIDHYIRDLRTEGRILSPERGNRRIFIIPGLGRTLSRFAPVEAVGEPERAENYTCSRCGCRNCARHAPARLVTRSRMAWGVVA